MADNRTSKLLQGLGALISSAGQVPGILADDARGRDDLKRERRRQNQADQIGLLKTVFDLTRSVESDEQSSRQSSLENERNDREEQRRMAAEERDIKADEARSIYDALLNEQTQFENQKLLLEQNKLIEENAKSPAQRDLERNEQTRAASFYDQLGKNQTNADYTTKSESAAARTSAREQLVARIIPELAKAYQEKQALFRQAEKESVKSWWQFGDEYSPSRVSDSTRQSLSGLGGFELDTQDGAASPLPDSPYELLGKFANDSQGNVSPEQYLNLLTPQGRAIIGPDAVALIEQLASDLRGDESGVVQSQNQSQTQPQTSSVKQEDFLSSMQAQRTADSTANPADFLQASDTTSTPAPQASGAGEMDWLERAGTQAQFLSTFMPPGFQRALVRAASTGYHAALDIRNLFTTAGEVAKSDNSLGAGWEVAKSIVSGLPSMVGRAPFQITDQASQYLNDLSASTTGKTLVTEDPAQQAKDILGNPIIRSVAGATRFYDATVLGDQSISDEEWLTGALIEGRKNPAIAYQAALTPFGAGLTARLAGAAGKGVKAWMASGRAAKVAKAAAAVSDARAARIEAAMKRSVNPDGNGVIFVGPTGVAMHFDDVTPLRNSEGIIDPELLTGAMKAKFKGERFGKAKAQKASDDFFQYKAERETVGAIPIVQSGKINLDDIVKDKRFQAGAAVLGTAAIVNMMNDMGEDGDEAFATPEQMLSGIGIMALLAVPKPLINTLKQAAEYAKSAKTTLNRVASANIPGMPKFSISPAIEIWDNLATAIGPKADDIKVAARVAEGQAHDAMHRLQLGIDQIAAKHKKHALKLGKNGIGNSGRRMMEYAMSIQKDSAPWMKQNGVTKPPTWKDLTPFEQDNYTFMSAAYKKYFEDINALRVRIGETPLPFRNNYFTFASSGMDVDDMVNLTKEQFADLLEGRVASVGMPDEVKLRYQKRGVEPSKINMNAFDAFERYTGSMEQYLRFTPVVSRVKDLMAEGAAGNLTMNKMLQTQLSDWQRSMAGLDRGDPRVRKFISEARRRDASGQMAGSVNTFLTQTVAIPFAIRAVGARSLAHGFNRLLHGGGYKEALRKSEVLRVRSGQAATEGDIGQSLGGSYLSRLSSGTAEKMLWPMRLVDQQIAAATWYGAYDKAIRMGMKEAQAVTWADDIVIKTSGSSARSEVSAAQRTAIGGALLQYQTAATFGWSFIRNDMFKFRKQFLSPADHAGNFLQMMVSAAAIDALLEDFFGIQSPIPNPLRAKNFGEVVGQLSEPIPLLGGALRSGIGRPKTGPDIIQSLAGPTANSYATLGAESVNLVTGQSVDGSKLAKSAGRVLGVPGTNTIVNAIDPDKNVIGNKPKDNKKKKKKVIR